MGLIIYGHSKTPIGFDEVLVRCPSCEKSSWADLLVESQYFHIYWLPVFPFDKLANLICHDCGLKRYGIPFDPNLLSNYSEIKPKFRHPIKTFIPLLILAFAIIVAIVAMAFKGD
jgi:hypothetical protein